jgi:hypothetical protein
VKIDAVDGANGAEGPMHVVQVDGGCGSLLIGHAGSLWRFVYIRLEPMASRDSCSSDRGFDAILGNIGNSGNRSPPNSRAARYFLEMGLDVACFAYLCAAASEPT